MLIEQSFFPHIVIELNLQKLKIRKVAHGRNCACEAVVIKATTTDEKSNNLNFKPIFFYKKQRTTK